MSCNPQVYACFERSVNHGYAVEGSIARTAIDVILAVIMHLLAWMALDLLPVVAVCLVLYANVAPQARHWAHRWRGLVVLAWNGSNGP